MTPLEYRAHKASVRAEQIRGTLAPFVEQRAALTSRQAYITAEQQRLLDLQESSGGSASITDQLAALEREWWSCRAVEARINEQEGVAKGKVANLRD